jgi:hypothetical protein
MEHRWGQRRAVILRIRLCGPGPSTVLGWLTNISLSGAYVTTAGAFAPFDHVTLEVDELGNGSAGAAPLQFHGRIVRHGLAGVGIEWEEFAAEHLAEISRIAGLSNRPRIDLWRQGPRGAVIGPLLL